MSVYAVALITIHDKEEYERYARGFMDIFVRFEGRLLAVDETPRVLEGDWPWTRTVLLEFPDQSALDAWYESKEYQTLAQHRHAASDAAVVMLRGLERS